MRISIMAGGAGSVAVMQKEITRLDRSIENTIDDLRELNRKIRNVNGGMNGNLESATAHINARISEEEAKQKNLVVVSQRIGTFLDNTIQTDAAVARRVEQNQKALFQEFPWLRPKETDKNPSFWAQLAASWNEFWGDVGDWVSDLVGNIVDYLKEHAVELIVGLVFIVVAAVLICLTGGAALTLGAFLAAFVKVLATTVVSALIGAAITGTISWLTGGSFWEAFGDDFATGFMIGGIFASISALAGFLKGLKVVKAAKQVTKSYPHSVLDDLKLSDDFHPGFKNHVFEGQINGKGFATGYHYEGIDDVAGKIVDGSQQIVNQFGAYDANVVVNGVTKKVPSTFFPKDWAPQKVVDSIQKAFDTKQLIGNRWVGICDDGMEIVLGLRDGKIFTAWPFKP